MTNLAGKVVGVIQVSNKVQGTYTEEDAHFLSVSSIQTNDACLRCYECRARAKRVFSNASCNQLLATQAAVTFDLCVKNDLRQTQVRIGS